MPVRSLNYTGRKRLTRRNARFELRTLENNVPAFEPHIQLDTELELPGNAAVCIEAYRSASSSWMRFPYGTVDRPVAPDDRRLVEFDDTDGVLFRVKVTSQDGDAALILAEADAIRPYSPDGSDVKSEPLLPVRKDKSLEDQVWRLEFPEGREHLVLLINSNLDKDIVRRPEFVALVLPAVVEAILTRILIVEKTTEDEDSDAAEWQQRWLQFAKKLPGTADLPDISDTEAVYSWIADVVKAFCRTHQALGRYDDYLTRNEP